MHFTHIKTSKNKKPLLTGEREEAAKRQLLSKRRDNGRHERLPHLLPKPGGLLQERHAPVPSWNWHLDAAAHAATGCRGFVGPSPSTTLDEIVDLTINGCGWIDTSRGEEVTWFLVWVGFAGGGAGVRSANGLLKIPR